VNKVALRKLILLALAVLPGFLAGAQDIDMDEVNAREDFRWGVIAYNKGNFNDAIRSFERSLSLKPENPDTREWLGNAQFRAGFDAPAMEIWESVLSDRTDPVLNNRVELQRFRQGLGREMAVPGRYVVSGIIEGITPDYTLFRRPASICSMPDGGFYMAAFGSNEVFYFDINGSLRFRINGGLEFLSSPFDVLYSPSSGYLYISEYNGNRIIRCSPQGQNMLRFGTRGRGDGQLLGPQFLAEDEKGYLYVTDYGNHRVVKFDGDGNYILSFGRAAAGFPGLREPTGIAAMEGRIYVADSRSGRIAVFDYSGNYLALLGEDVLSSPEGLSPGRPGELIVVDSNRVFSLDLESETFTPLADLSGSNVRLLKAVRDANGNLLSSDFNNNRVSFLTDVSRIYTGLAVQVERVDANDFPEVLVDIRVEDPLGNPIVGLTKKNFYLTELSEARYMVDNYELVHQGNLSGALNAAVLVDRSPAMRGSQADIRRAVSELYDSLTPDSTFRVVDAGELPVISAPWGTGRTASLRAAEGRPEDYRSGGRLDLGIRLAAGDVLTGRGYKAVVYITRGTPEEGAFRGYSVLDTARYLRNNGIRFYVIYTDSEASPPEELEYICRETGGSSARLFQAEGLTGFFDGILATPEGSYTIRFTSRTDGDFGRRFIPLQAEVLLYNRSGRERSGYFPPVDY